MAISSKPNAWVEPRICNVRQQVDPYEPCRREHQDNLDDRIIAELHCLEDQAADARPTEDRLDNDGTAEQRSELQAQHRHNRECRIAERMPNENGQLADALRTRRPDVVCI